jgi:FixJ family two-component response regulator
LERSIAADHNSSCVETVEAHRENIKHKLVLADAASLRQTAVKWVSGRPDSPSAS